MYHRTDTVPVKVGNLTIGGNNDVIIQSMCTTKTADVKATVAEIHRLEEAGCQLVRVTVNNKEAAEAIKEIKKTDFDSARIGHSFRSPPCADRH